MTPRMPRAFKVLRSPGRLALAGLGCCALALAAQAQLDRRASLTMALGLFGLAAAGFVGVAGSVSSDNCATNRAPSAAPHASAKVLLVTLLVSLSGCLAFGGNQFRLPGVVLWLGGLGVHLLYLWLMARPDTIPHGRRQRSVAWLLVIVVLVGAWLRLRLLDQIPADMGWDLPYNYYDVQTILRGRYPVFFPANLGREGLFFYFAAFTSRLVGLSQYSLQLTSALIGVATLLAVYALGSEAFGSSVGLMAAGLAAVSRWHIILSRPGYRVILMPLLTTLALWTLIRALRRERPLDFAVAGATIGLGLYTYKSFVFVPVALAVGFVIYVVGHGRAVLRRLLPGLLLMALVFLVVAAPLARFVLEYPQQYLAREQRQLEVIQRQPSVQGEGLLAYFWRGVLAFNYKGDSNTRFNVPAARHMGFVSGSLMVLGLAWACWRWRSDYNAFFVTAWAVLVLPTALTMLPNELPNVFRMSGDIGVALVLAALPLATLWQRVAAQSAPAASAGGDGVLDSSRTSPSSHLVVSLATPGRQHMWLLRPAGFRLWQWVIVAAALVLLRHEATETYRFYFRDYVAVLPDQANYSVAREMAQEMSNFGQLSATYVKVWPHWFDGNSLRVNLRNTDPRWNPEVLQLRAGEPPLNQLGPVLVLLNPQDQDALRTLQDAYPRGVLVPRHFPNGSTAFLAFYGAL